MADRRFGAFESLDRWEPDGRDAGLNVGWRWRGEARDRQRDGEVDDHADRADAFGADSPEPVFWVVRPVIYEFEVDDIPPVKRILLSIPAMPPSLVVRLLKIPKTMMGKKLDAARPKANAPT